MARTVGRKDSPKEALEDSSKIWRFSKAFLGSWDGFGSSYGDDRKYFSSGHLYSTGVKQSQGVP